MTDRIDTDELKRIITNLRKVEEANRDAANEQFHRAEEAEAEVLTLRAENERLRAREKVLVEALAQAAVPLEGLTLAAHMSESNMGLCKGAWDEINNGVKHIRAALADTSKEG